MSIRTSSPSTRSRASYVYVVGADSAVSSGFMIAVAWQVAHLSDAPWALSLVLALETLPRSILIIFGGAKADEWGLLTTATRTLLARILLAAAFGGVLLLPNAHQLAPLAIIAVCFGLVDALHMPAIEGLRGLIAPDETNQGTLTSRTGMVEQLAEVLAIPAAATLVALKGGVVGWAAAAILLTARVALRAVTLEAPEPERRATGGVWAEVRKGVLWAWHVPGLPWFLAVLSVSNLVATAPVVAGIPARAQENGWPGWVFGLASVGLVLGMVAGSYMSDPEHQKRIPWAGSLNAALGAIALSAAFFAVLSMSSSPWIIGIMAALGGFGCKFTGRTFITAITLATPGAYQGRVQGLIFASIYSSIPLSYGVYAALRSSVGLSGAGLLMAAGLFLCASGAWLVSRRSGADMLSRS